MLQFFDSWGVRQMTFKEAKLKREATADESGSIGTSSQRFTFYEFFAGGGMAHAGLVEDWRCLFEVGYLGHFHASTPPSLTIPQTK